MATSYAAVGIRFIPTCVGNRKPIIFPSFVRPVHPHSCGEQGHTVPQILEYLWFIPTRVGNSFLGNSIVGGSSVHPHSCGEQSYHFTFYNVLIGTSPLVWGTDMEELNSSECQRFIPTCVGNSLPAISTPDENPVHPHDGGNSSVSSDY